MSLRRAILLLTGLVLVLGVVPAGVILERRLEAAFLDRAREDLANASRILEDRLGAVREVRMMHAKEFSSLPGLARALEAGAPAQAWRMLESAAAAVQEAPLLVGGDGQVHRGSTPVPQELVDATREGAMPVEVVAAEGTLHLVALAPLVSDGRWVGAVGGSTPFADDDAATLAGLTRSRVVILSADGALAASTLERETARSLAEAAGGATDAIREVRADDRSWLVNVATLDDGLVLFARDMEEELALLPELRTTALATTGAMLALALLMAGLFARRLAAPVTQLADAAEDFGAGRPDFPMRNSSVREVRRLAGSFASMRQALAARLDELARANMALAEANRALEDRQDRLATLQAELVQRERLASSGRLLAQLAHEIRNPVASVRNCLEVVRRRGDLDPETARFADMAVDELLRMHELAERMLDLHRPRDRDATGTDVSGVVSDIVKLITAGPEPAGAAVSSSGTTELRASIHPDDLKQVLLNLVLNAVEASPDQSPVEILVSDRQGRVRIEVLDRGPGFDAETAARLFDPFFTTKDAVQGVGLGLYTADGLVRAAGGTIVAEQREDGPGARLVVELPAETESGAGVTA